MEERAARSGVVLLGAATEVGPEPGATVVAGPVFVVGAPADAEGRSEPDATAETEAVDAGVLASAGVSGRACTRGGVDSTEPEPEAGADAGTPEAGTGAVREEAAEVGDGAGRTTKKPRLSSSRKRSMSCSSCFCTR